MTATAGAPATRPWDDPRVRSVARVVGPAVLILIGQAIFFPIPFGAPGVYLYGITLGLLTALVALGMALIYRANRILNFAQGELGLVPTVLAVCLTAYSGVPWIVSLVLGIAAALLLGGLTEFLIVRRFFRAPRLILTVATIGVSQLLAVAALALPLLWVSNPISLEQNQPFDLTFELNPIKFNSSYLLALVIPPLVMAGVAVFLRSTTVGIAIRASAERADRANLLGVPVKRLQTLVWALAALLSFVGVFLKAGMIGVPVASNQGFGTTSFGALLAALTALTLGRFTNLPAVAVSAVALGVLEQAVVWNHGNNLALVYPVFAVVILIALTVTKVGQSRAEHDTAATWTASDEVRPIPAELGRVPEVLALKWGGLAVLCFLAYQLPSFGFMTSGNVLKATAVVVFAIVGVSLIVLTGWAGQVSLGQMGFVGVGSAVGAWATATQHWDLSLALLVAGIAGALAAVVVGLPALRLRGLFLAVTTLAFTIAASNYLLNPQYATWIPQKVERVPLFGTIDLSSEASMYYLCLIVLGLSVLALTGLRRSRTGRVLLAVRENERGVQAYGVNLTRTKLAAFAVSGFLAAVAGCLFIHVVGRYSVEQYGAQTSFAVFTSTVVGGLGSLTGGILGAVFGRGGTWFLPGNWQLLPSALGVLVVLWVFPAGLGGLWFKVRDLWLRSVATRNGILVPSMVADVGQWERPVEDAEESAEAHDAVDAHDPSAADPDPADPDPAAGGDGPPGAAAPPGGAGGAGGVGAADVAVGGAS